MLNVVLLLVGLALLIIFLKWFWSSSTPNSHHFQEEFDEEHRTSTSTKAQNPQTNDDHDLKKIS
jgi:hypothetical protein